MTNRPIDLTKDTDRAAQAVANYFIPRGFPGFGPRVMRAVCAQMGIDVIDSSNVEKVRAATRHACFLIDMAA